MGQSIRVLSYNIHKGFHGLGFKRVLDGIRQAIEQVHADLVFLQEVRGEDLSDGGTSQFEYLADRLWPHYAYGKNAVTTSGHHGNAVLSRFPISAWENVDVSKNPMESRGILHAEIEIPGQETPVHLACLHLSLFEKARQAQLLSLCRQIRSRTETKQPLIVAGDFNDWRETATPILARHLELREAFLERTGTHARTFPSFLPWLKLDRLYYRSFRCVSASEPGGSPWRSLSDHAPLLVELELIEPQAERAA
jgi:endonuclease/exonuclease/phosphatase family metal-dependent hydrolase